MSARFRVRASGPYPASYARRPAEAPIRCPGFLSPFGMPAFASWASCSRHGFGLSLRSAYRTTFNGFRTLTGFPRFTYSRHGRGGRPLYPEASGVHATDKKSPVAACRSSTARPYTPVLIPPPEAHNNEASTGIQFRSPVRPSPCPHPPDGTGRASASSLSFAPRNYLRRTSRRGPVLNTHRELRSRHHVGPPIREPTRSMRPRVATSFWYQPR